MSEEVKLKLSKIPDEWKTLLSNFLSSPSWEELLDKVSLEYEKETVYPPVAKVYDALEKTAPRDVKCVIIGQDPYFNPDQANGLAFSVSKGTKFPPSLLNIYKELYYEYGYPVPKNNGDLSSWAKQGVLLLNATLTVKAGEANSHSSLGWSMFTDEIIKAIDSLNQPVVYLLWGRYAQAKETLIHSPLSYIIKTAHPSPLSANHGFFCSDCFIRCNRYLKEHNLEEIDFQIKD